MTTIAQEIDHQLRSETSSHSEELIRVLRERRRPVDMGAEIGVLQGATSRKLLEAFPELVLIMADLWSAHHPRSQYAKSGDENARFHPLQYVANEQMAFDATAFAEDRRILLRGKSSITSKAIGDESLEFAFIDADHTYDAVKADIEQWWPKVRPSGVLSGHDYNIRHDRRGQWGVKRAVTEFASRVGLPVNVGRHYVWWIEKPAT